MKGIQTARPCVRRLRVRCQRLTDKQAIAYQAEAQLARAHCAGLEWWPWFPDDVTGRMADILSIGSATR